MSAHFTCSYRIPMLWRTSETTFCYSDSCYDVSILRSCLMMGFKERQSFSAIRTTWTLIRKRTDFYVVETFWLVWLAPRSPLHWWHIVTQYAQLTESTNFDVISRWFDSVCINERRHFVAWILDQQLKQHSHWTYSKYFYRICYNMCTQRSPYNWSEQLYTRHGEVSSFEII